MRVPMRCLFPQVIRQRDENGFVKGYTVPCGKCYSCLSTRRSQWAFRLEQELKVSTTAYFVTLTYDDASLPFNDFGLSSVSVRDCQLFLKRLRNNASGSKIRYFLVSEYGPNTFRPHYHGIFFNVPGTRDQATDLILNSWQKGHVVVGTVTGASISYCAKYCLTHHDDFKGRDPTFCLMSRKPGIGYNYVDKFNNWHQDDISRFYAVKPGGHKVSLPRYYQEKIYDDSVRMYHAEKIVEDNPPPDYYFSVPDEEQPLELSISKKEVLKDKLHSVLKKTSKL